jgi:hypothetical protein
MSTKIEIEFSEKINKWVAYFSLSDKYPVGVGDTPLEALGDCVCNNCRLLNMTIVKKPLNKLDLLKPPTGGD